MSGYSDKEISIKFKGDSFGADDYARLTGKSLEEDKPAPEPEKQPEMTAPTPTPSLSLKPNLRKNLMFLPLLASKVLAVASL